MTCFAGQRPAPRRESREAGPMISRGYPVRLQLSIALGALVLGLGSARGSPVGEDAPGVVGAVVSDPGTTRSAPPDNDRLDGRDGDLALHPGSALDKMGDAIAFHKGHEGVVDGLSPLDKFTNRVPAGGALCAGRVVRACWRGRALPG